MEKRDIAQYEQFLLFPQCFQETCTVFSKDLYMVNILDKTKAQKAMDKRYNLGENDGVLATISSRLLLNLISGLNCVKTDRWLVFNEILNIILVLFLYTAHLSMLS